MVEEELAASLGVSRNVVREAFWQLEAQGLVTSDDYRGKSVTSLSFTEIAEIIPLRLVLESMAANSAARNITPEGAQALRSSVVKFTRPISNFSRYAETDFELHHQIWNLAGSKQLATMLDRIAGPMIALQARVYQPKLDELILKETEAREGSHTRIVEAICSGKATKARLAMQKHILAFWQLWLRQASETEPVTSDSQDAIADAIDLVSIWASVLDPSGKRINERV